METKALNEYFKKLDEIERKADQFKEYMDWLRSLTKERENQLFSVRRRLKAIEDRIDWISSQIPNTLTEVIAIESENKILCKQIEVFEQKISDSKQKISEMFEKRIQSINKLSEESFNYCQNYGLNGRIRTKSQVFQKEVQTLEEKRNELKNKSETLNQKHFESTLLESNSLNDRIHNLKTEKTTLQNENSEWSAIDLRLRTNLKQLRDNESKELIDLRKQLQQIEEMEANKTQSHIESQPPVIHISDSNYSIDKRCSPPSQPSQPSQSVVSAQQSKKRPQSSPNSIENKRIVEKKVTKSENRDNSQLWEYRRQRSLLRKSNN